MIELTDEMVAAFLAAWDRENRIINESAGEYVETGARDRAGLAAVLAIVERDRRAECGAAGPDGKWCVRMPHQPTEYHGWVGDGELVQW